MIVNEHIPQIEASNDLDQKSFSIGDAGIIFDVLRNKMYSNPVLAICREISCNARDAHREVGKLDLPIQIYVPNHIEPFLKIKDFGPGISPDRMENIFLKYGKSSKRETNELIGYFGLGSKTPFSYTDSFTIITNYNNVKYNYVCYIDETRVGKLALLSSSPTTEENGTEIIIPVKSKDFELFAEEVFNSTKYWNLKPQIFGTNRTFTIPNYIQGNNWRLDISNRQYNLKLIVDEIEYSIDYQVLRSISSNVDKYIHNINGTIQFLFKTGEVSLSANREQVYLDDRTKAAIKERSSEFINGLEVVIQKTLDEIDDYWKANVFINHDLYKYVSDRRLFSNLTWRGTKLLNEYQNVNNICFSKTYKGTIRKSQLNRLEFGANSKLVFNDLDIENLTVKHVNKLFEDKEVKSVNVLCCNKNFTEAVYNDQIHLNLMNYIKLSSITKSPVKKNSSGQRLIVYRYNPSNDFSQVSINVLSDETSDIKVLCNLHKSKINDNHLLAFKENSYKLFPTSLLRNFNNVCFYGVNEDTNSDKVKNAFNGFIPFEKFLIDKLPSKDQVILYKLAQRCISDLSMNDRELIGGLVKKVTSEISSESFFIKRNNLIKYFFDLLENKTANSLYNVYEEFFEVSQENIDEFLRDNPEYDYSKINSEYFKKYGLLEFVDRYYIRHHGAVNTICDYINLVDRSGEQNV